MGIYIFIIFINARFGGEWMIHDSEPDLILPETVTGITKGSESNLNQLYN
jgi:hypothetical protein